MIVGKVYEGIFKYFGLCPAETRILLVRLLKSLAKCSQRTLKHRLVDQSYEVEKLLAKYLDDSVS